MRRLPSLGLSVAVVSAIAVGCFSSSSNSPSTPDSGDVADGSALPTPDASSAPDSTIDAPSEDDSALDAPFASDRAIDVGEAGTTMALSSCATPTVIDSTNAAHSAFGASVGLGSGKYVVLWAESSMATQQTVLKARFFDGTTLQPVQTINAPGPDSSAHVAADGLGHAYAAWTSGLSVLSPATGSFGTSTPIALLPLLIESEALVGLRAGGAFVLFTGNDPEAGNARGVLTTRYDPAAGTWSAPESREDGTFSSPHIATNASGKTVAAWLGASANGVTPLSIASFDGTTWAAPVHSTIGTGTMGTGPDDFALAEYSNGDVLLVYSEQINGVSRAIEAQRYRLSTGQWDAPVAIETASPGNRQIVAIDDSDRVTVVYQTVTTENRAVARRDLGSGWTPAVDLGGSYGLVFSLDPSGNPVVLLAPPSTPPTVRRAAASGTTWDGPVSTGFLTAAPNSTDLTTQGFDGMGHPLIVEPDVVQSQSVVELTICQ